MMRLSAAAALMAGASLLPSVPAASAATGIVHIPVSEAGFAAPATQRAGAITFQVATTAPGLTAVGLLRLHRGVPLERVLGHIRQVFDDDPAVVVSAGRAMMRDADQLGTAATEPGTTVTFRVILPPGRYYLVDYHRVYDNVPGNWVRQFDVAPWADADTADDADPAADDAGAAASVVLDEPRMLAPARMVAGAPYRVVNTGNQPNEAVLMPVRPGATRAELRAFFIALDTGAAPPSFPIVGGAFGLGPISSGHSAVVTTSLPAGSYVMVTWFPDFETTRMLAAQGMFAMVTLV